MDVDVIIVGGGLSGLTTAALLVETGLSVMVLEAGERPGGRVKALRDEEGTHIADLGPSWVWPAYQPVLAEWLERLGLDTFDQFEDGEAIVEMEGRQTIRRALPPQSGIRRVEGGPSAIVDALLMRIPEYSVVCNTPVRRITQVTGAVEVGLDDDIVTARRLVCAVPPRIAAELDWRPGLPKERVAAMQATPTWMAAQAKAVALYETPFWREEGLSGRIASQVGPLVEAHDLSGPDGTPATPVRLRRLACG